MLSESTARLVEHLVVLAEPELVRIKGSDVGVRAHRLIGDRQRDDVFERADASLVGRRWEMAALDAIVERAISGRGGVVNVVGPPGIGKSRAAREAATLAADRGVEVFWTFCESHASDIPFAAVTRLLAAATGSSILTDERSENVFENASPMPIRTIYLILDDLLGIADPTIALPIIDRDARRRRLTALINAASLARTTPALFIIEDAHWIDPVSESMVADFLTVIPRTLSMVLITSRPEYHRRARRDTGRADDCACPTG